MPDDMKAVVAEWLAMAESCARVGGLIRYPPVSQSELDAIRALLSAHRKMVEALEEKGEGSSAKALEAIAYRASRYLSAVANGHARHPDDLKADFQGIFDLARAALTGSREQEADHAR